MATKRLLGILKDANGIPLANTTIRFSSTSTRSVLNTVNTDYLTNSEGAYDFSAEYGVYTIQIKREDEINFRTVCANAYVYSEVVETLELLIKAQKHIQEIDETIIQEMLTILASANAAALSASDSADIASTKAAESSASASAAKTSADNSAASASVSESHSIVSGQKALEAKSSADASAASAASSSASANSANASAQSALASKTTAEEQATIATNKAAAAALSEQNALASKQSAENSASIATTKAAESGASATAAQASANSSATSAGISESHSIVAGQKALEAKSSADASAASAASSSAFADNSEDSALGAAVARNAAEDQANLATSKAASAALSEQNALASKQSAELSASTATTEAAEAVAARDSATASAAAANSYKDAAEAASSEASLSAGTATTKAAEASNSAASAELSKNTATTKAAESSASAATAQGYKDTAVLKASEAAQSAVEAAQSAALAAGALIEAGSADLSSGVFPTPIKDAQGNNRSCFWKVIVGGSVAGDVYGIGDSLVYSKEMAGYYKIDNTEAVSSVNGKQGVVVLNKADVGLANVDNTSDLNKPVSTATQSSLDLKVDKTRTINSKPLSDNIVLSASDVGAAPASHVGSGGTSHATATTSVDGFMSKADKSKLDAIAVSANNYVHPASGVSPGTYKSVTVDGNGHVTGGSNPTTVDGYGITDAAKTHSPVNFGESATPISTADFITQLTNLGAFNSMYWCTKVNWTYAYNNYITDTGVGVIQLAGCTVEVIGGSTSTYTIRIHTAPSVSVAGAVPNADFVYVNHGAAYGPKWHKIYNTDNKPTAVDVGALPLTGGTLTDPLTIQSNSASSNLLSILNETDGWTWMKIGKSSLSNQGHFAWHTGPVEGHAENSFHFRPKGSNTVLGISSGAATIGSDSYLEFLPNSNWGAKLRVGGNGRTAPDDGVTASITTTNGNVHIDGASGSRATYLNFYSGTDGVKFGNGAESVVGNVDSAGNMSMNGTITTPRVQTGTINGTGSSVNWASLDVSGIKGGYSGINFPDAGHWFGVRPDGLSGVWKSDGNSKWYFNELGVLTGGAKILWDTIIDHPTRINWASKAYVPAIVTGQLAWKHHGNGHTIFDASSGTTPDGTVVDKNNSQIAWSSASGVNYPTLMGWNGTNTYGVRVDSARSADLSITADRLTGVVSTNGQDLKIHDKRAMVGAGDANQLIINYGGDWGSTAVVGPVYLNDVQSGRHVVFNNGSTSYSNSGLEVRSTDGSDARIGFHQSGTAAGAINFSSWGFQFEREAGRGSRANVAAANFFADAAQDMTGNALTRKDYVDGALSSKFDKTGGTISGDITTNTNSIRGANGAAIVKDHGNGNTTFSGSRTAAGTVGNLYLGYHDNTDHFTNKVLLCKSMYSDANQNLKIIDYSNGALFDKGAAVIGANRDNVLNNSSFGVGFLSAHDAGAQWIAGYFGKNGGSNQVVVGEINGGAVIGGHTAAKNAWSDLYIGTAPSSGGNNITHISMPYARVQGNATSYEILHRGIFDPGTKLDNGGYGDTLHLSNWIRTSGATGWYNETYGGGLYMTDSSWVRVYNGKKFFVSNTEGDAINTDGGLYSRYMASIVGDRWLSENGGSYEQNRYVGSPIDVQFANGIPAGNFAPFISSYAVTQGNGYTTRVKLGMLTSPGNWAKANLFVGGAEGGSNPMANYTFDIHGNVAGISTVDAVNFVSSRTDGVTGLELRNTGGNPGLSFHRPGQSWAELRHDGTRYYMGGDGQNFTIGNDMVCSYAYANGAQPQAGNALTRKDYVDSKASLSGATFTGQVTFNHQIVVNNASTNSILTQGGIYTGAGVHSSTTVTGTTGVYDGSNRVFSAGWHPNFSYDRGGTATTLWTGSSSSHPTTITLSEIMGTFSKIRFEGVNSGASIAWATTLSVDELAAICNTGLLVYIASGVYSYTFNPFTTSSITLTRNTSVNGYLTKIVGIR